MKLIVSVEDGHRLERLMDLGGDAVIDVAEHQRGRPAVGGAAMVIHIGGEVISAWGRRTPERPGSLVVEDVEGRVLEESSYTPPG